MANDLNVVCLVGNITRTCGDQERDFGYTQGGMCIANVAIASNRSKKQGTEYVDDVSYFNIRIFGKTAESLKPFLVKGQKIAVEGVLKQDRWQDKNGNPQSTVYIIANTVQLVGERKTASQNNYQQRGFEQAQQGYNPQPQLNSQQGYAQPQQNYGNQPQIADGGFPEDIPF